MLPQKNALEIARICDLLTTNPELVIDESHCALSFIDEGVFVTSRLVVGTFPDYEQIIPKEYSTKVVVLKNDLLQTLKKTQVFLNKFQQVSIKIIGQTCEVSSQNGEVGTTTDQIRVQTEGDDISLNFNQQYVYDVLSHLSDDTLHLHFAGIGRPLVIRGVNETSVRYLVMPMNR
jgi:DNA polymerase-3 subunit beta